MAAEIKPPGKLDSQIKIFREIEIRVAAITPEQYRRSTTRRTREMRSLGKATDRMQQLYTLNLTLADEVARLHTLLIRKGTKGNEEKFALLNRTNLTHRIVGVVLGLEVAEQFNEFGVPFDIDEDGVVVAPRE